MNVATVVKGVLCLSTICLVLAGASPAPAADGAGKAAQPAKSAQPGKLVNINTAGAEELESLPRIGPALALRIIEYREKEGPFKSVEEIVNVRGIGEKTFLEFKDRITVGNATGSKS